MGFADLFRPKHRHSDVRVRSEAVKALTADDAATLINIARTDRDVGVRRLAMERIGEAETLADIAAAETERSLRDFAGERAAELWLNRACSADAESAGAALTGIIKLGEQHALVSVVVRATVAAVRKRALAELRDPRALAELAKSEATQDLRVLAVARIDDGDVLRALAIDCMQKEVGLAAVDRLEDLDRLEHVAQKAKNKAVGKRARKIIAEITDAQEQAERAAKPVVSDDVKRRRAEKAQLLREVEGVADSFDFARVSDVVRAAEAAWGQLAADDGDDRFVKATIRFWKRKELHDSQARSGDELRIIEREAREQRERAARERDAKAAAAAVPAAPPTPIDPAIAAAEAEERAARATAEAERRAEDDARRVAQAAEREARAKEDAERGVAIATSLRAMCDDMEQLAASKDGRGVDRLLAQSAKGFENLGKVSAADRDAIGERYRTARGKLVIKQQELAEAEDWARFANVPKADALIATAKELAVFEPAPADLGDRLKGLQALWKEVGALPQKRSKELWEQFKTACDLVYDKVKGVRAVAEAQYVEIAAGKEKLIAEAEALADSTDWAATAEKLKALQAAWKASGYLPRKQGDELWNRFRGACDKFFERRKPLLDAAHEAEGANLASKQALVARAREIAEGAPGVGGWGKAIGEIKDLQHAWREIGFVPRRDADAVYAAFRGACDALFQKRDAARDGEANAHRAELDAMHAEIDAVLAGGDDAVTRAIAVRAKLATLDAAPAELTAAVARMVRHVIAAHADALKGTELDPAALRGKREKLIAKAEQLLPKPEDAAAAPADLGARLTAAMRKNAFGDLRFSGRDPIEVIDELRVSWAEIGPDAEPAQASRFEAACAKIVAAANAEPEAVAAPIVVAPVVAAPVVAAPVVAAPVVAAPAAPVVAHVVAPITIAPPVAAPAVVISAHDAVTAPVAAPTPPSPQLDDIDTGWDT